MTLLTDMANAETAMIARIEREIEAMSGGSYQQGALTQMITDLATLRALIKAKKI
jgi:hypothetical protein